MTITIRTFQDTDAHAVGILIAATFARFNLDYATPDEQERLLGPFRHAWSDDPDHQATIAAALQADMIFVAETEGKIVGVLRGRPDRLQSLFVDATYHRQGIGRKLVQHFEEACSAVGTTEILVAATLFAVPFYSSLGYIIDGDVETGPCFDGEHFMWQPMKKTFGA